MTDRSTLEVVAFDADDTLWKSEDSFYRAESQFVELVDPYTPPGIDTMAALRAQERATLSISGYGVKAYTLSAIEAALTVTEGSVPTSVISELIATCKQMLTEPVQLLPHVPEVLAAINQHYRVVLITKGDLVHQQRKVTTSGLEHHFEHVEILLEKDPPTYARILRDLDVPPERFVMFGNSVRSDVYPVHALGAHAVHIPYHLTWEHEMVDHDESIEVLDSIAEVPDWLRRAKDGAN